MNIKKSWSIIKGSVNHFLEDRVTTLAAALSYYAIFSIGPLLVIIVGLAGMVVSQKSVRQQIAQQIEASAGPKAAKTVDSMISAQHKKGGIIATAVGIAVLLLGATGIFGQLKQSLNTIWEVQPKPGRAVWGVLLDRLLGLLMLLAICLLLLLSTVLTTSISGFSRQIPDFIPVPGAIVQLVNLLVFLVLLTLLFGLIFKVLPDVKIRWRDVRTGAFVTALLFLAGQFLMSLYLSRRGTTSAYGAAGSVVVILLWIYYSSAILFFGAEFTKVYARETGSRIEPSKYAMRIA